MKKYIPFVILEIVCLILGHQWEEDPSVSTWCNRTNWWRPGRWCKRCRKAD